MKSMISKPLSIVVLVLSLALVIYSVLPLLLPKAKPEKFEIVWSDDTYCRFNTVFGGTDYNEEVMKYFEKNPYDDYENLLRTIGSLKSVSKKIEKLNYGSEEMGDTNYVEVDALDETSDVKFQLLTADLIAIGFIENYNVCAWEHGSKTLYVISEKDKKFSFDNYHDELYHVGSKAYIFANTEHIQKKEVNGYTIYFIGGYKNEQPV